MMPKKSAKEKRSVIIGVKVDEETKKKLNFIAELKGDKTSTYIYNLLKKHIEDIEPWISKELEELRKEETDK